MNELSVGVKVRIKGKEEYGVGTIEYIGDSSAFGKQTCIVRFSDRAVKVVADEIERVIETIPESNPDTITISRERNLIRRYLRYLIRKNTRTTSGTQNL